MIYFIIGTTYYIGKSVLDLMKLFGWAILSTVLLITCGHLMWRFIPSFPLTLFKPQPFSSNITVSARNLNATIMIRSCAPFCKWYKCWLSNKLLLFYSFLIGHRLKWLWKVKIWRHVLPYFKVKHHILELFNNSLRQIFC